MTNNSHVLDPEITSPQILGYILYRIILICKYNINLGYYTVYNILHNIIKDILD